MRKLYDMRGFDADSDWWAARYEDLMIITDEMYEAFYTLMKCK